MGLLDTAKNALDSGLELAGNAAGAAARAATDAGVEHSSPMRELARLCDDGSAMGWHEANGGNVSVRLSEQEAQSVASALSQDTAWMDLGLSCPGIDGALLAVTAAGSHLRLVSQELSKSCGIVEIGCDGSAWRPVWGFADGAHPTSELASHVLIHDVRAKATGGSSRILYHAHPANIVALTMVTDPSAKKLSRILWKSLTESIMLFPEGLGYVPWMVPGTSELAQATAQQMEAHRAVIWAHHGLFASAKSFEGVFGLMQTADKAAGIYLAALAANGGSSEFASSISDAQLIRMCDELGLDCKREWLEG